MSNKVQWNYLYNKNCPPNTATQENVHEVYRLVDTDPPTISDFTPHMAIDPSKYNNKSKVEQCDLSSTSVFENKIDIQNIKKLAKFRHLKIAKGQIKISDGKIQRDNNSHINWWINISEPQKQFKVIP